MFSVWKNLSIKHRLQVVIGVFATALSAVIILSSYTLAKEVIKTRIIENGRTFAESRAKDISTEMAFRKGLVEALRRALENSPPQSGEALYKTMEQILDLDTKAQGLFVVTEPGSFVSFLEDQRTNPLCGTSRFRACLDNVKEMPRNRFARYVFKDKKLRNNEETNYITLKDIEELDWYKTALTASKTTIFKPYFDAETEFYDESGRMRKGIFMTTVASQISLADSQGPSGAIGLDVNLSTLSDTISGLRFLDQGTAILLDKSGLVVAHPDKSARESQKLPAKEQRILPNFLKHETFESDDVVHVAVPVGGTDWTFVLNIPNAVVYAPLYSLLMKSLIILGLGIVAGLVIARFVAGLFSAPLIALSQSVSNLAEPDGELAEKLTNVEIPHSAYQDEIGNLSDVLHALVATVKQNISDINRKSAIISILCDLAKEFSTLSAKQQIYELIIQKFHILLGESHAAIYQLGGSAPFLLAGTDIETVANLNVLEDVYSKKVGDGGETEGVKYIILHAFDPSTNDPTTAIVYQPAANDNALDSFVVQSYMSDEERGIYIAAIVDGGKRALDQLAKVNQLAEIETARTVQQALLPEKELDNGFLVSSSVYLPSATVGGDWYGFVETQEATFIIIADATGHGTPAALIAAIARAAVSSIRSLLSDEHTNGLTPAEICVHLNRLILESGKEKVLMTGLCIKIFHDRNKKALICNAAHVPPVVCSDYGAKFLMKIGGSRLGFDANSDYMDTEFDLPEGSKIFLCTDGLTEAHNPAGAQFGNKRLKTVIEAALKLELAGKNMVDFIKTGVVDFQAGRQFDDDVTAVLVERFKPVE